MIGTLPREFRFLSDTQMWTPLGIARHEFGRQVHFLRVIARLKPGASLQQADARMRVVASQIAGASNEPRAAGVRGPRSSRDES